MLKMFNRNLFFISMLTFVTPYLARYDSDQQLSPALKAIYSNIICSHVCMYASMCECSLYLRYALVSMFLSSFWIQIWYHFYLQSIWLIYLHIHISKTMSASNLTNLQQNFYSSFARNICCFFISTPSDSIGSKSYLFFREGVQKKEGI